MSFFTTDAQAYRDFVEANPSLADEATLVGYSGAPEDLPADWSWNVEGAANLDPWQMAQPGADGEPLRPSVVNYESFTGTGGKTYLIEYLEGGYSETFLLDDVGNRTSVEFKTPAQNPGFEVAGSPWVHLSDGSFPELTNNTWSAKSAFKGSTYWQSSGMSEDEAEGLAYEIAETFPWASELGFIELIKTLVVDGAGPEQIIAEVRRSDQYQQQFPGMMGPGGVRRYRSEGEYLTAIEGYRNVLKDFGAYDPGRDNPANYTAFMDAGIDSNELQDRFEQYRDLEAGSQNLKDAFYVYAGMDITTDDLFTATVSPQFREELTNEFDIKVAAQPLDYETFIARATVKATDAVIETLESLSAMNATTGAAVSKVMSMQPEFGRQVMASLFTGGTPSADTDTLSLAELKEAFSAAIIGSAASSAGWEIPTLERIEEYRAAGIQNATIHNTYQNMRLRAPGLAGMMSRAGRGAAMDTTMVEEGILGSTNEVSYAQQAENALGRSSGGFQTGQQGRRFTQTGRSTGY